MTAGMRAVPRKRRPKGPSFEARLGRQIVRDEPRPDGWGAQTGESETPGFLARLVAAAKPESDADATLQLGLGILTVSGWGISGSLFVGLMAPGIVLTFIALLAYLRPRGEA